MWLLLAVGYSSQLYPPHLVHVSGLIATALTATIQTSKPSLVSLCELAPDTAAPRGLSDHRSLRPQTPLLVQLGVNQKLIVFHGKHGQEFCVLEEREGE